MTIYSSYLKRLFDIGFSFVVICILTPFFLIISLIIAIDSKGPVFFMQKRLGKNMMIFEILKFRTMTDKVRIKETQVLKDNREITSVGRWLRRFKIDELPQIFNVLLGQMSVVGPRPALAETLAKHKLNDQTRFRVKPGLTSIAGVNGSIYLSWKEKWWYDKYYAENLSFALDIKIIFKTILVVILGEEKFIKKPKI